MKTIALENSTYAKLSKLKSTINELRGTSLSFNELLEEIIRKPAGSFLIDSVLRDALKSLIKYLSQSEKVLGVILFGSIAKGTSHAYSDVDLFILARDIDSGTFDHIEKSIRMIENEYFDRLAGRKLPTHFSPFICSMGELDFVRPIFFDIADSGIVIFDRYSLASEFVDKYLSLSHSREFTENGEVLTW